MLLSKFSPILIFTISGRSMFPTFSHGDKVLVVRALFTTIKNNDVLIFQNPQNHLPSVKRVKKNKADSVFLVGDNKNESTDSRSFGWIKKNKIIGKVIAKI